MFGTQFRSLGSSVAFACVLAFFAPRGASANIALYDLFKVVAYNQTSVSQPVTPIGYFGSAEIIANTLTSDLTGGNVTSTSNLSPMDLASIGSGVYHFQSSLLGTQSDLDLAFPNGTTYTYNATGGAYDGQSADLSTPASDAYSATVPYITGVLYNTLQNFNPSNALSLTFNGYSAPAGVNGALTFIAITNTSDNSVAFSTVGDNTLTSASLLANTLLPGTNYDLTITYSARTFGSQTGFTPAADSFVAYDLRTDLLFTTAAASEAPEPSTALLAALGVVLAVARRKPSSFVSGLLQRIAGR